jgi:hypothetical protein
MNKTEISIEELAEDIMLQQWEMGVQGFHVIEDFSRRKEFNVEDLYVEIEDDFLLFCDSKNILINSELKMILSNSLIHVYYYKVNGIYYEDLRFTYGDVHINSIAA